MTFVKHLKRDLKRQSTAWELSLLFQIVQSMLQGMTATHVDDTHSAVNPTFEKEPKLTVKLSDAKPSAYDNLTVSRVPIVTRDDGSRFMHEAYYGAKLHILNK